MALQRRPLHYLTALGLLLAMPLLTNCSRQTLESTQTVSKVNDTLVIWWEQGYHHQEDEAIQSAVETWQQETGHQVELLLIGQDVMIKKIENALKLGTPPDIFYFNRGAETTILPWARDGLLADVSEVVEPLKDIYSSEALKSSSLFNRTTQKYSTYAVPLNQRSVHVHYSKPLLEKAGLSKADIPTEWDAFWTFWQQAQDTLRDQGDAVTYGLGLTMSSESHDTYSTFEQILEAYDIQLFDENGNLQLQDPQIQNEIVTALDWYTSFYKTGYVPPSASDWLNRDNNTAFLNQELLMVVNPTLSIPVSQREDEDIYNNQIATIELPDEPDGETARYRASMQQMVVFESAVNKEMAKDFLIFLMQPENIAPYVEGTSGRFFPVMQQLMSDPFWTDSSDPHISIAIQQFEGRKNVLNGHHLNPAYGVVQSENVWGYAIDSIVTDNVSPEAAAAHAIHRIEEIFADWKR
ncbi:MAG: ABC transporter substrate-binding protein [Cyanobacteria bacterium P01_F01_bin.150]